MGVNLARENIFLGRSKRVSLCVSFTTCNIARVASSKFACAQARARKSRARCARARDLIIPWQVSPVSSSSSRGDSWRNNCAQMEYPRLSDPPRCELCAQFIAACWQSLDVACAHAHGLSCEEGYEIEGFFYCLRTVGLQVLESFVGFSRMCLLVW